MRSEIDKMIQAYEIKKEKTVAACLVVEDLNILLKLCNETRKKYYQEGWNDCRTAVERTLGLKK